MCKIVNCGYTQTQHKIQAGHRLRERERAMKLEFNACIMLLFFVRLLHIFGLLETSNGAPNGTSTHSFIHSFVCLRSGIRSNRNAIFLDELKNRTDPNNESTSQHPHHK